ncbi:ABC transporter substrate-binding protein [Actinomyces faecalis]|uniref:ABC transporter substrate-binding protein n=1 Tax=Actinomyces faecalis TaxID=2722820 RepID=UPI0015572F13|nr:ABC transporter substrate-binding protein [Actinomyces faecalis]
MKHLPALAALAASACLALTACTSASDLKTDDASSGSTAGSGTEVPSYDVSAITKQDDIAAMLPDSISSDGKLTIGVSADYPPAEFLDTSNQPVGYDIDLSRALAAVLGLEATAQHAEFDSIIPAIGSKYDLGISSFTITPEREASTEMVSYISIGSQFNVAKGNPTGLDLSDTLGLCGLTVGVQTGTAQEEDIQGFNQACTDAGKDAIDVKSYALNSDATTALAGGTLDAVFSDSTVAGYAQIQTDGAVETAGKVFDAAPQGIVIAQGDEATAKAIQAAVQYLMDEGIWNDILSTWGVDTSQALTTAEINPAV